MSEAKKILETKVSQVAKAGSLFLRALGGDADTARSVVQELAVTAVRERGRPDLAKVIDAEFEEGTDE